MVLSRGNVLNVLSGYCYPAAVYCQFDNGIILHPEIYIRYFHICLRDIPRPAGCGISPLKFEMAH